MHDVLCFSHLRWGFVTQRPNHLMRRAARDRRVFFVEEPVLVDDVGDGELLEVRIHEGVHVVRPVLAADLAPEVACAALAARLDLVVRRFAIRRPVRWYYTPMALPWSEHVDAAAVVYDCMDELSAFRGAPAELAGREQDLLAAADLVFTGGASLYRSKRAQHPRVTAFPSSVDAEHFRRARLPGEDHPAQAAIAHPRIGWFGVIDERVDLDLVTAVADRRPDWQLVLVGPFAKIDEALVPRRPNIHWLGRREYDDLPDLLRGWDAAIMPFGRNEATRFISPTKTPEYLAAGRPVVSTSIADVVEPYGRLGLVRIADDAASFEAAIEDALADDLGDLRRRADLLLGRTSWDATWAAMDALVTEVIDGKRPAPARRRSSTHRERPVTVEPAALAPLPSTEA